MINKIREILDTALNGATAASNMVEIQAIQNLQNIRFN
jgi:hypothetical protein